MMTREEMRDQVVALFKAAALFNPHVDAENAADAAIAIIRGETLQEAAKEMERQLYVERHPLAQAIRALKEGK